MGKSSQSSEMTTFHPLTAAIFLDEAFQAYQKNNMEAMNFYWQRAIEEGAEQALIAETFFNHGLRAYLANDDRNAEFYWQEAVKEGSGRAAFELGLLHRRRQSSQKTTPLYQQGQLANYYLQLAKHRNYVQHLPTIVKTIKFRDTIQLGNGSKISREAEYGSVLPTGMTKHRVMRNGLSPSYIWMQAFNSEAIHQTEQYAQQQILIHELLGRTVSYGVSFKSVDHRKWLLFSQYLGESIASNIPRLELNQLISIIITLLQQLKVLHENGYMHGKINSKRVVISENKQSGYLIDFRLSRKKRVFKTKRYSPEESMEETQQKDEELSNWDRLESVKFKKEVAELADILKKLVERSTSTTFYSDNRRKIRSELNSLLILLIKNNNEFGLSEALDCLAIMMGAFKSNAKTIRAEDFTKCFDVNAGFIAPFNAFKYSILFAALLHNELTGLRNDLIEHYLFQRESKNAYISTALVDNISSHRDQALWERLVNEYAFQRITGHEAVSRIIIKKEIARNHPALWAHLFNEYFLEKTVDDKTLSNKLLERLEEIFIAASLNSQSKQKWKDAFLRELAKLTESSILSDLSKNIDTLFKLRRFVDREVSRLDELCDEQKPSIKLLEYKRLKRWTSTHKLWLGFFGEREDHNKSMDHIREINAQIKSTAHEHRTWSLWTADQLLRGMTCQTFQIRPKSWFNYLSALGAADESLSEERPSCQASHL